MCQEFQDPGEETNDLEMKDVLDFLCEKKTRSRPANLLMAGDCPMCFWVLARPSFQLESHQGRQEFPRCGRDYPS